MFSYLAYKVSLLVFLPFFPQNADAYNLAGQMFAISEQGG